MFAAFAAVENRGAPRNHREGVIRREALSSPTGQRYLSGTSRVLLFVREQRKRDGRPSAPTEPFVCLGFARYEGHEGERPMAIRWRLEREIPAAWLPVMALAV